MCQSFFKLPKIDTKNKTVSNVTINQSIVGFTNSNRLINSIEIFFKYIENIYKSERRKKKQWPNDCLFLLTFAKVNKP
jgi:hypothetical protein